MSDINKNNIPESPTNDALQSSMEYVLDETSRDLNVFASNLEPNPESTNEEDNLNIARANPELSFLFDNRTDQTFDHLIDLANESEYLDYSFHGYNFDVAANNEDFNEQEERQCANYTSSVLGLSHKIGAVMNLIPFLMQKNYQTTGTYGLIFGFNNFIRGDVVAFRGTRNYAIRRYGHVGVVRDRFEVNGIECIAIQHEGDNIQVEIIPVNPADNDRIQELTEIYQNENLRVNYPALTSIYQYRSGHPHTVEIVENAGYYGDASCVSGGNIAFAVRTRDLVLGQNIA
jgi:hypothetical protein